MTSTATPSSTTRAAMPTAHIVKVGSNTTPANAIRTAATSRLIWTKIRKRGGYGALAFGFWLRTATRSRPSQTPHRHEPIWAITWNAMMIVANPSTRRPTSSSMRTDTNGATARTATTAITTIVTTSRTPSRDQRTTGRSFQRGRKSRATTPVPTSVTPTTTRTIRPTTTPTSVAPVTNFQPATPTLTMTGIATMNGRTRRNSEKRLNGRHQRCVRLLQGTGRSGGAMSATSVSRPRTATITQMPASFRVCQGSCDLRSSFRIASTGALMISLPGTLSQTSATALPASYTYVEP